MTVLIVLGIILLFFLFVLSLKAKITIAYNGDLSMSVRVLCFKIRILPKKEKPGPHSMSRSKARKIKQKLDAKAEKKKNKKLEKRKKKEQLENDPSKKKKKEKKSLSEILDIITLVRKLAVKVIRTFFKHLRIEVARLKITVATGDAATTAIAYGAITEAVALLYPVLESVKNFRVPERSEVEIRTDFCSDTMDADIMISFSLRVWHVFDIAFGALGTFIKHKISSMKKSDAGKRRTTASHQSAPSRTPIGQTAASAKGQPSEHNAKSASVPVIGGNEDSPGHTEKASRSDSPPNRTKS